MKTEGQKARHVYFILDSSSTSWNYVLPDGKTVLERQLHLLSVSGIRDFVLLTEEYLPEKIGKLADSLIQHLPGNCCVRCVSLQETIQDMQKVLSEKEKTGSVILLPGFAVYDQKFAKILTEAEEGSAFLSKSAPNRVAGSFARIDFKHVCELRNDEAGAGCFPVLPMYKLDYSRVSILQAGENPMQIIKEQIDRLDMKPVFDEDGYVRISEDEFHLTIACKEVLERDCRNRRIEKRKNVIVDLADWLEEMQVRKPMLVYDGTGMNSPVADMLEIQSVSFVQAPIQESLDREAVSGLLDLCREEGCDGVVSVGGVCAVHAAKLLRVCCVFSTEPSENMLLHRSVGYFPHISIPMTAEAVPIETGLSVVTPGISGVQAVNMIPDITVLDPILTEREELQGQKTADPGTNLLGRIRKAAWFTWCKHRWTISNQSVVFASFHGSQAQGNPRGIYEALRNAAEYHGFQYIWAVKEPQKYHNLAENSDTKVVKYGSRDHLRALASSRYVVDDTNLPKYVRLNPEQVYIRTFHVKAGGMINLNTIVKSRTSLFDVKKISHLCVPSSAYEPFAKVAFGVKSTARKSIVRVTGNPQNDRLFRYSKKDVLRIKLALGIPLKKKVVLYIQAGQHINQGNSMVDLRRLYRQLEGETVLLFRNESGIENPKDLLSLENFVLDVTGISDMNDLLIISDLLICDDPGSICDYANLHRPIVLLQTDQNELNRGFFNLEEIPGKIVTDQEMLAEAVRDELLHFSYDEKYRHFNETYNTFDGVDCGIRMVRELISPDLLKTEFQLKQEKRLDRYQRVYTKATGFLRGTGLLRNDNDRELLAYRGKYKGQRCFLVGNGPSLRLEDLEAIRYEYSFACNKIYHSFDRTNWRPTYYCFTDKVFESELDNFRGSFSGTLFSNNTFNKKQYEKYHIVCAHNIKSDKYYVHGNMIEYYVPSNATVMTFMLELAMYMGFSEIYLIGVDCSNGFVNTSDHFMNGYMTNEMEKVEQRRLRDLAKDGRKMTFEELGRYRVDRAIEAYRKLRIFADKHHIKVFNATRGGCLDAFERVDFDRIAFRTYAERETP